ncbi:hypothetical protein [Flavobacterium sp.]|uniref:hypothetical protein n=1 Tax=Flavobacterium sp. TaxID=239 RepID=UPI0025F6A84E|nr:hypothetical protein [Flavobacterium sp.]
MKTKFIIRLSIVSVFLLLLMGCSNDENNKNISENAKVNNYLARFYKKNFHIGNSVEAAIVKSPALSLAKTTQAKSEEYEGIKLTEVFVGEDERARGYIVTDKVTDEFLYFVDVDRENYKLTAVDILENEIKIKDNINMLEEWASSNKLDLIKLLDEYNQEFNSGTSIQRKFWGWTGPRNVGGCDEGWQTTVNTHYILGIIDQIVYNEVRC